MVKGIDVSKWQNEIDWTKVAKDGIQFAFIKATEGITYTDPMLRRNALGAEAVGIALGFYHFLRPDNDNPEKEAENFLSAIKPYKATWLVCDVEDAKGKSREWVGEYALRWLQHVEKKTGKKPLVYTYINFANTTLGNYLKSYPLWIAHYTTAASPSSSTAWGNDWVCWQYTDKGKVQGISGNVDMNYMRPQFFEQSVKPRLFIDLPPGHWAEAAIKEVSESGLMVGLPDGSFGVNQPMTRAEMAVVLSRLMKIIPTR